MNNMEIIPDSRQAFEGNPDFEEIYHRHMGKVIEAIEVLHPEYTTFAYRNDPSLPGMHSPSVLITDEGESYLQTVIIASNEGTPRNQFPETPSHLVTSVKTPLFCSPNDRPTTLVLRES